MKRVVYIAGPEVFLPEAADIGRKKMLITERAGFEGIWPLNRQPTLTGDPLVDIQSIARYDATSIIKHADFVIANLTPFNGPSADVGTCVKVGIAHGRGLPIFGYTSCIMPLRIRLERWREAVQGTPVPWLLDDPVAINDNLMIEGLLFDLYRSAIAGKPFGDISDTFGFDAACSRAALYWEARDKIEERASSVFKAMGGK